MVQAIKNKVRVFVSQTTGYLNVVFVEAAQIFKFMAIRGAACAANPTPSETEEEVEPPLLSEATA